ncbi:hypothetical protein FGIG_06631 [Fasciola gigantica]|uniref:Uncharacterized protein n=1 Tax=Fasciola gigantica TaxID=46835 RepID=A0A504YEL8_FASGI|nr:hypothetical protein FGIG_06631 [Fasciola gigantica]
MQSAILVFTIVCSLNVEGYIRDLADVIFEPLNSAFILDSNSSVENKDTVYFATASNVDTYSLRSYLGIFQKRLSFTGDKEVSDSTLHASVHLFNTEVDEKSKSIHFVCHVIFPITHKSTQSPPSSTCCVISLNTTFSHEFTSCVLGGVDEKSVSVCHAQARLPVVLWKQKNSPVIALSYTVFKVKPVVYRKNKDNECYITNSVQPPVFHLLPTATVVRSVPDAIRELGRSLLLQIPRRELRTNEEFMVPVRLKRGDEVSDFTLRVPFHYTLSEFLSL